MEYSDEENGSDIELIDDILGPEDLFNEADGNGNDIDSHIDNESAEENSQEDSKKKVEKKISQPRTIKKSRKTPNYDTLKGNNGLSALKKLFKNFKFKGNGFEKDDLTKIMGILQQWMCYQLCPQYQFESGILELEALGKKRIVQVLLKQYRMGMDEWGENEIDAEDSAKDIEISENTNEFDLLLNQEIENVTSNGGFSQTGTVDQTVIEKPEAALTQEQLERIARNKKLAEERRLKRMNELCQPMKVNQEIERPIREDIQVHPNEITLEDDS